jgi:hypothetical protein
VLGVQHYRLESDGSTLAISGGSDVSVLHGAYTSAVYWAGTQNKHGVRGICTSSGDALSPAIEKAPEEHSLGF